MEKKVLIETSARHIHLSVEDLNTLFGEGHQLTPKKELSQPGQYACVERVDVVGSKRTLSGVSILGPVRPATQVEISLTDARSIGCPVPTRLSGDIKDSGSCKLVGPKGEITLESNVIAAKRHIHADPASAEQYGLKDHQVVSVAVKSQDRSMIFGDVVVRVHPEFRLVMHIDTDEANAAGIGPDVYGEILCD